MTGPGKTGATISSASDAKKAAAIWHQLLAEAAFLEPDLDVLDGFYRAVDAVVHGRELEPGVAAAMLRAYAISLGLLPREVGWAVRTARLM